MSEGMQTSDGGWRAYAPGHVTGFFTVDRADDPMKTGSRGAGVTIADGVTVTVRPSDDRSVSLNDERVDVAAVDAILDALRAQVAVAAETPLPLGAGFGVSGAMALATAFATNAALDRGLSADELTALAHGADVRAETGLGDVVAQARGGAPIRLEPGAPRYNQLDGIPTPTRDLEYLSLGRLDTAEIIGENTEGITAAGRRALSAVVDEPTLQRLLQVSRQFSREAELVTPEVREVITAVGDAGGDAMMGMLGETVVAFDDGLTVAGYDDATSSAIDPCGVRLDP